MDQNRLGHENQFLKVELSTPPAADNVTVEKNAPQPMPIVAFASASVRSAAATSGRRCSTSEGTPTGMEGGAVNSGRTGSKKVRGEELPVTIYKLHARN